MFYNKFITKIMHICNIIFNKDNTSWLIYSEFRHFLGC